MNYKEEFRKFAMRHGFLGRVILDSSTFFHKANVAGCFSNTDMWAVYQTDENGTVYDVQYHCSDFLAYCDLARRFGYDFKPFE